MNTLRNFLWVGLGGGLGAMLRFFLSSLGKPGAFPYQTLFINIAGSLFIGVIFALTIKNTSFPEDLKLFLATGLCGGFTTFSAFSLENMQLMRTGNYLTALFYIFASVALCIIAAAAGFKLANN